MISKNTIKKIKALKHRKFRQKYNKFIVEGHKSCIEFLQHQKYNIEAIYVEEDWSKDNISLSSNYNKRIYLIDKNDMAKISSLKTPSPILLVCEIPDETVNLELNKLKNIIYLDGIQDPGNLGAIIRIGDWFGCDAVVSSQGTVDYYNPKVIQSSMGSMCGIKLISMSLSKLMDNLTEHSLFVTDMYGKSLFEIERKEKWVVAIGNEGSGVSTETLDLQHQKITIPGDQNKVAESLNAAISAGIVIANFKLT